ncbi:hypothetical protein Hanom_Chr03g00262561 [Helianthus anomalus]
MVLDSVWWCGGWLGGQCRWDLVDGFDGCGCWNTVVMVVGLDTKFEVWNPNLGRRMKEGFIR